MTQRFYLHNAASSVPGTLPSAAESGITPVVTAAGATTARSMDGTPGSSQVSQALTTNASTSSQRNWFRLFVSPPLAAGAYGLGGTATISVGASESNANSDMFELGSCVAYFWRPSTGARVHPSSEFVIGGALALDPALNEPGTSQTHCTATKGTNNLTILDGDVLVFELWSGQIQAMAAAYTNTVFYDGTTEGSTTSIAAYFDAGVNIPLYVPTQTAYRNPMAPLIAQ